MKYEISSQSTYQETLLAIFKIMGKGQENLTQEDVGQLSAMVVAAEKYEDEVLGLKPRM